MRPRSLALALTSTAVLAAAIPASANAGLLSALLKKPTTASPAAPVVTVAPVVTTSPATAESLSVSAVGEMTATCSEPTSFKAFAKFGDTADYAFAPGGSFESGAPGWSLSGASVVSGNETAGVFTGSKALKINDGGRVVSPWFCVTADHPNFRFVTYGGEVEMEIDYKVVGDSDIDDDLVGETNGGTKWAPSASHELATEIPAAKLKQGVVARIIFEAEDNIFVDNVLVDPYRRG